jgi:hypothetical protein
MAKVVHHYHHDRHLHRQVRSSEHQDRSVRPQSSAHLTCDAVRGYVAQVGLEQALAVARSAGMTSSQERTARRCIESKS